MIDPRENTDYDPREEMKTDILDLRVEVSEKLKDCGYSFAWDDTQLTMVHIVLPKGKMCITLKQALRQPMANIKALIEAAMNQDEIKAGLPSNPVAPDDEISI